MVLMSNEIGMTGRSAIIRLFRQNWSQRRIARELGYDRKTIHRHIRIAEGYSGGDGGCDSNSPISPLGYLRRRFPPLHSTRDLTVACSWQAKLRASNALITSKGHSFRASGSSKCYAGTGILYSSFRAHGLHYGISNSLRGLGKPEEACRLRQIPGHTDLLGRTASQSLILLS